LRALVVALINIGAADRARLVVGELLAVDPRLTIASLEQRLQVFNPSLRQTYLAAFRSAGLPE
jgi:hypothetical protein